MRHLSPTGRSRLPGLDEDPVSLCFPSLCAGGRSCPGSSVTHLRLGVPPGSLLNFNCGARGGYVFRPMFCVGAVSLSSHSVRVCPTWILPKVFFSLGALMRPSGPRHPAFLVA
ncbi:hypothetical protein NDU88_001254 [Pleurodeles waltl]|uniref:Uncharacterized protein n=1 Tax=Pleurodeles waltl TaxID=8319 RepID=A0AAV7S6Z0_PLEWA|nr:hypothetical protein NDU88_001254 [Pleurodeles waltl]